MNDLRKQFTKETGMVAHYQDSNGEDINTQFSYEYTEWLEKENKEMLEIIKQCHERNDAVEIAHKYLTKIGKHEINCIVFEEGKVKLKQEINDYYY